MRSGIGNKHLVEVSVRDIADILEPYKEREHPIMAQIVRRVIIDVFKEAQHAGEVPPGFNPVRTTKNQKPGLSGNASIWKNDNPFTIPSHHSIRIYAELCCSISTAKRACQIGAKNITTSFSAARDQLGLKWNNGPSTTFHEQRVFPERLYRDQDIDTMSLPGHKNQQMTDKYNGERRKNLTVIAVRYWSF